MAHAPHPTAGDPLKGGSGYEERDAHVRPIFLITGGLALLCVLALILATWMFGQLDERVALEQRPRHPLAVPGELPPGPLLQANPPTDLEVYVRQQREVLETYGWIDPVEGIVRVPVERALELVLAEGLPSASRPGREDAR